MQMRRVSRALAPALAVMAVLAVPNVVEAQASRVAGAAERAVVRRLASRLPVGRAFSRTAATRTETRTLSTLALDRWNHRMGRIVKLPAPQKMSRYTSLTEGRRELRHGIPPMRHLTPRGGPGRPLSAPNAKRVLGLRRLPGAVLKVPVPKGQPVIVGPIAGGARRAVEVVSPRRIPSSPEMKLIPLKK